MNVDMMPKVHVLMILWGMTGLLVVGCEPSQGRVFLERPGLGQPRELDEPEVLPVDAPVNIDFQGWSRGDLHISKAGGPYAWDDPEAWESGEVPKEGDRVQIVGSSKVTLSVATPSLSHVLVQGELSAVTGERFSLTTESLVVSGSLTIGSEKEPRQRPASITLAGPDTQRARVAQERLRVLQVLPTGRVSLVAKFSPALRFLTKRTLAGSTELELDEAVSWPVGTNVVVAPRSWVPQETELRKIDGVDDQGRVTLQRALESEHEGRVFDFVGRGVDLRAEVFSLWRPISIRGVPTMNAPDFGASVLVQQGGEFFATGVSFVRMGQRGISSRAPVTVLGAEEGEVFVKHSSFFQSRQGCVSVLQAQGVVLEENVAHDIEGHCFGLLTPFVRGTILRRNVVTSIHGLSDQEIQERSQSETMPHVNLDALRHPGAFYARHPDNVWLHNRAAGGVGGVGFKFDVPGSVTSLSGEEVRAYLSPITQFEDNVAHGFSHPESLVIKRELKRVAGRGFYLNRSSSGQIASGSQLLRFVAYGNEAVGVDVDSALSVVDGALVENRIALVGQTRGSLVSMEGGVVSAKRDVTQVIQPWEDGVPSLPAGVWVAHSDTKLSDLVMTSYEGEAPGNSAIVYSPSSPSINSGVAKLQVEGDEVDVLEGEAASGSGLHDFDGSLLREAGVLLTSTSSQGGSNLALVDEGLCRSQGASFACEGVHFPLLIGRISRQQSKVKLTSPLGEQVTLSYGDTTLLDPAKMYKIETIASDVVLSSSEVARGEDLQARLLFGGKNSTPLLYRQDAGGRRGDPLVVLPQGSAPVDVKTSTAYMVDEGVVLVLVPGEKVQSCRQSNCKD